MDSYTNFAYLYDSLMNKDVNYDKWVDYIENLFDHYDKSPNLVADLACGTGNFTIPLAKRGYEMIGVDRSADMLNIAREKAYNDNLDILFLNQNLSKLDLYGSVDAFLCMIDGLNYIISQKSIYNLFYRIKNCFLEPDGIFIFDISSNYKLSQTIGNNTFIYNTDDLFYTWENKYFEKKQLSDMFLTFFKKNDKLYDRFEERHLQRAYTTTQIITLLKKAGFSSIDTYDELTFNRPTEYSQRIVFVAR